MQDLRVNFVDAESTLRRNNNIILSALYKLCGDRLKLVDSDPQIIFYGDGGRSHRDYKCIKVYVAQENKMPNFRYCDYAFSYHYFNDERNCRLPFYVHHCSAQNLIKEASFAERAFEQKTNFCSFVVSNSNLKRTSKRIDFFKKLSKYKKVDSGGALLNNLGFRVRNKYEFLNLYKFNIAFENRYWPGYTSEKITDAMRAACLPVYWGNPLIHNDFDPKSFINVHHFTNDDEAIEYIIDLDKNDDKYLELLRRPFFHDNKPSPWYDETRIIPFLEKMVSTLKPRKSFFYCKDLFFNLRKNLEPYHRLRA